MAMCDDITYLILSNLNVHLHIRLVCVQWNNVFGVLLKERFPDAYYAMNQIMLGNHKHLSFESSYRAIYNMCITKNKKYVFILLSQACRNRCFNLDDSILRAMLCEDICCSYVSYSSDKGIIFKFVFRKITNSKKVRGHSQKLFRVMNFDTCNVVKCGKPRLSRTSPLPK